METAGPGLRVSMSHGTYHFLGLHYVYIIIFSHYSVKFLLFRPSFYFMTKRFHVAINTYVFIR